MTTFKTGIKNNKVAKEINCLVFSKKMLRPSDDFQERSNHIMCCNYHPANLVLEVGFLVRKKMKFAIIGFEYISEQLSPLILTSKFRDTTS